MFYIYVSTMHVCGVVGGLYPGFVRTAQLQHVQCTLWWDWRPANEPCPALLAVKERVEENRRVHKKLLIITRRGCWMDNEVNNTISRLRTDIVYPVTLCTQAWLTYMALHSRSQHTIAPVMTVIH